MLKLRSLVPRVGRALAGLIIALGLIEGGFRVYYFIHPSAAMGFLWVPSEEYGWGLAPGREGPFHDDHEEFRTHVRINSLGLHDVEHTYTKPPGVFRILILGDSYVEALQVELDQGFGRVLERQLRARTDRPVEVISGGVSAWGTDNEFLFFRNEGYKYDANLVLLAFNTADDLRENYEPFNRMAAKSILAKPTFVLTDAGVLEMQPRPPAQTKAGWWRQLYVGEILYERMGGKVESPREQGIKDRPPDPKLQGVPADMWVYAPLPPEEVNQAWELTKPLVWALREQVIARGARFAVIVHNGPWVHDENRWRFMLMHHPDAAKSWDRRKPERLINMFLLAADLPVLDLFDAFEAGKDREQLFFKFDPHWTPAGHRVAAEAVAEYLLARDLIPRSGGPMH